MGSPLLVLSVCAAAASAAAAGAGHTGRASTALVDVFTAGRDGYACFRIPAIVYDGATGRLLAIAEGRRYSCADHGYVDLVAKASTDGGATWGPLELIRSESSARANVTVGNPCPVQAAGAGGLLLLPFCRENAAVGVLASPDLGRTWRGAVTNVTLPPDWTWVATGPPGGIALTGGPAPRLLVPIDFRAKASGNAYYSAALLSDDGGASWRLGAGSLAGGDECQAAELTWAAPGPSGWRPVLLTSRSSVGGQRIAALSADGGDTWGAPRPIINETECEGSTVALPDRAALVTSSAFSATSRANLTLHASADGGRTWAPVASVYAGSAAYSALCALGGGAVGVLFERDGYGRISYAAVDALP